MRRRKMSTKYACPVISALLATAAIVAVGAQAPKTPNQQSPLESNPVGIFEGHRDVGDVAAQFAGGVEYDKAKDTYTVSGSGENMWFGRDAFHFAWKRLPAPFVKSYNGPKWHLRA